MYCLPIFFAFTAASESPGSHLSLFLARILSQAILQDLFPDVDIPEHDYGRLQLEIEDVQVRKGLQPVESQVRKVIQLYETMIVRHGVMLVGPTGSGKTTVYQVGGVWWCTVTVWYYAGSVWCFDMVFMPLPVMCSLYDVMLLSCGLLYGQISLRCHFYDAV